MGSGTSAQGWAIAVTLVLVLAAVSASWIRAWRGLRRTRIVIHDIKPENGVPAEAILGLSAQLRQKVREELRRKSRDAYQAEKETLDADITSRLMSIWDETASRTDTGLSPALLSSMSGMLVRDADQSISELFHGLGAAGPPEVQGLIAVLGSNLPAQRGWNVLAYPIVRGTDGTAAAGLTVELSRVRGDADEVTTFWDTSEALQAAASVTAEQAAIRELLHGLLRPAAIWVAIRLVARNLEQRQGRKNRLSRLFQRHREELSGLQWQIAGQMSLYATRSEEKFALSFARQAVEDLEQAEELLPGYYRPPMTQGFVWERRGWAYRRAGDALAAGRAFTEAIRAYDRAEEYLRKCDGPGVDANRRDEEIEAITVRRTKCRLLSDDCQHAYLARGELAAFLRLRDSGFLALYNAACAFAVATQSTHLPGGERSSYERQAWQHLGRALLASGQDDRVWSRVMVDEELAGMQEQRRADFCAEIRKRHDGIRPLTDEEARQVVEEAIAAIGLTPPSPGQVVPPDRSHVPSGTAGNYPVT